FFVVLLTPPPPACTLFPYTTLFRSWLELGHRVLSFPCRLRMLSGVGHASASFRVERQAATRRSVSASASTSESCWPFWPPSTKQDRKSTRLNSSHVKISYAVFCLKK